MKILKKMIILIMVIICIILGLLFILNKSTNENIVDNYQKQPSIEEVFEEENKLQLIDKKSEYFNIKNCINTYSRYSKDANKLLSIIPNFVKNEMSLNITNVCETIGLPNKIIRIDKIYKSFQTISTEAYQETTNICAYFVKGYFIDNNNLQKEEFKVIILLDLNNSTFLAIPQRYIEEKQINVETGKNFKIYSKETIENNEYNTFTYSLETAEDMSKEYFNRFKDNLSYDLEYVYTCLNSEYREERFENYNGFKEYIQDNKQHFKQVEFEQYMVEYNTEYVEYVCKDQNGNLYIFKETSPLNFELKLDTYTITTEKFKSEYQEANIQEKVAMNIDKWVQMLNNRDYTAAYNLLDETFKNNKFGSEEKFEQYMRNKYPLYYEVEFSNFSSEANLYIQDIILHEFNNKEGKKETLTIIMQLKEEFEFVMSFNVE